MKILIADDHTVVRKGRRQILDLSLPGRSGLEVLKEIKQARPKLPVLILSMHLEDQFAVGAQLRPPETAKQLADRLEVPAGAGGLAGAAVSGMGFSPVDGRATWASAGVEH